MLEQIIEKKNTKTKINDGKTKLIYLDYLLNDSPRMLFRCQSPF